MPACMNWPKVASSFTVKAIVDTILSGILSYSPILTASHGVSKLAGFAFGTDLDADTYLARSGGRVLNPNAEMLFQGPVIRDFSFSFLMIARNKEEGDEIRRIIRFLKLGMAPKFRNTTYLKNPDIFTSLVRFGSLIDLGTDPSAAWWRTKSTSLKTFSNSV